MNRLGCDDDDDDDDDGDNGNNDDPQPCEPPKTINISKNSPLDVPHFVQENHELLRRDRSASRNHQGNPMPIFF